MYTLLRGDYMSESTKELIQYLIRQKNKEGAKNER
jgi:hypothetical protein